MACLLRLAASLIGQQEARAIVVHVTDEYGIERKAHERAVHCRERKHSPRPQRRKEVLDPLAVRVEEMFDPGQVSEISLRE